MQGEEPMLALEYPGHDQSTEVGSSAARTDQIIIEDSTDMDEEVFESFMTVDPMNDEMFAMRDLLGQAVDEKRNREEFESNLHDSVRGIKQLIQSLEK